MSDNLSVATMKAALSDPAERGAFSVFPKLPLELRRMIWWFSCCLNQPRLIHISKRYHSSWSSDLIANYKIPGQLQASQESRESALRFYDFAFGSQMQGMSIYFNFDTDALVFDHHRTIVTFIRLSFDAEEMQVTALAPLQKTVVAIAVLDGSFYVPNQVSQVMEALKHPPCMQIIAPRGNLMIQGKLMKKKYQSDWLLQNPGGRDGYLGPRVNSSTIKQFQTMLVSGNFQLIIYGANCSRIFFITQSWRQSPRRLASQHVGPHVFKAEDLHLDACECMDVTWFRWARNNLEWRKEAYEFHSHQKWDVILAGQV